MRLTTFANVAPQKKLQNVSKHHMLSNNTSAKTN